MHGFARLAVLALLIASGPALAGGARPLSEPGSFELLALGGVVAIVLKLRHRLGNRK
jgi:hypothetical protein